VEQHFLSFAKVGNGEVKPQAVPRRFRVVPDVQLVLVLGDRARAAQVTALEGSVELKAGFESRV
jgi:hypothetical protein